MEIDDSYIVPAPKTSGSIDSDVGLPVQSAKPRKNSPTAVQTLIKVYQKQGSDEKSPLAIKTTVLPA